MKQPNANTRIGVGDALLRTTVNEGFYEGASAYWARSEVGEGLGVHFPPQVGVVHGEIRRWWPVGAIPTKQELHELGIPPGSTVDIRLTPGLTPSDVREEMVAKGHSINYERVDPIDSGGLSVGLDIKTTIDRTLQRAVAKIAYNYLAFHAGAGVATMAPFDGIRRYIRYDARLPERPVTVKREPILRFRGPLAHQAEENDPIVHVVAVEWRKGQVVGQVSLFYRLHYWVVLADGGFIVEPDWLKRGHIFDPIHNRIVEAEHIPSGRTESR